MLCLVAVETVDGATHEGHVVNNVSGAEHVQCLEARLDDLGAQREADQGD